MQSIFKSRKFWLMIVDVAVSLLTYFTGRYLNPEFAKDILFLIGALQPVVLLVIGSIAAERWLVVAQASWILHSLIFLACAIFYAAGYYLPEPGTLTTWSSVLRLHGYITVLTVTAGYYFQRRIGYHHVRR
jgi:hypothetical protein